MARGQDNGLASVEAAMRRYDPDPAHALCVARLSAALFDALEDLHGLGRTARRVLVAAALLHDTGYANRPLDHHKGSRDLIVGLDIEEFSPRERQQIACVARYHRKSHPKASHKVYRDLSAKDQSVVRRLAALLRIADGLDRLHAGTAAAVRFEGGRDGARLYVRQSQPDVEGLWAASHKALLFEEVFDTSLEIVAEDA